MSIRAVFTPAGSIASAREMALAEAQAIFCLTNPTLGTAISGHAAPTTFDETKALLYLFNNGSKYVHLMKGALKLSNAGTAGTTIRFTGCLDVGPRTPTGGTAAANTLNKGGTGGAAVSNVTAYFGAVVIPAPSNNRQIVHDAQYRDVIGVVRDTYGFVWGGAPIPFYMPQTATNGTSEADIVVGYDSVVIPPGYVYTLHQWSASQSGAYQFEPVSFSYAEV